MFFTKNASDDEDEDDDNITTPEPSPTPQRKISPLASEDRIDRPNDTPASCPENNVSNPTGVDQDLAATVPRTEGSINVDQPVEDLNHPLQSLLLQWAIRWVIVPDRCLYFYWKAIVTLTVMYNFVVIILRIAFQEMRNESCFGLFDGVCDIIYLLDFIIESKTCYLSNGSLIFDAHLTLQNYLSKDIIKYDVIAVIPIKTIVTCLTGVCSIFGCRLSFLHENYYMIEPALRLNRLAKSHSMHSFFSKAESRTNSPNLLRAFRLTIELSLVIHWIACLYYMISEYEGLGSTEWAYPSDPQDNNFKRKYIVCMYWSIMTLTTIGERPSPVSDLEFIFTGLTFLIGVFVFAAVVGNVGEVISNMNAARRDFQTRMDQIKFYLNHRQVPEILQTRIKRWAEYTWDRTKAVDEPSVLQWLPERLRTEVAIHVHLSVLKKVSIFDQCEEGLLRELVLKLKPQIYSPGDYICRIGEIGREMYIINHGQVEILFPDVDTGAMRQVAVMNPGNFFGEISLLKLDEGQNKRTADVRSVGFSELLCLSRRDLMVALTEYPEAKRILEEYARERFQQTKKQASSRQGSVSSSPRDSITSSNSPISARQIFARVMRKEGFSDLLKRQDTDMMAIKNAVEELKATNSAEVHQTFIKLHKEIQDLSRALVQKDLKMQQANAEIAYLKTVIKSHSLNPHFIKNGSLDDIGSLGDSKSYYPFTDESRREGVPSHHGRENSLDSSSPEYPFRDNSDLEDSQMPSINANSSNQYYKISFPDISHEEMSEKQNPDKSIDMDSTFNSSDDDSGEDMVSIEKKFDKIGKDDDNIYYDVPPNNT